LTFIIFLKFIAEEAINTYQRVLKSELFGADSNGIVGYEENAALNVTPNPFSPSSPPRRNLFQFKSPKKTPLVGVDSPHRDVYSLSPIKMETQEVSQKPQTTPFFLFPAHPFFP